nr:MAG TPA: hypothetical protein [Caudoviricetes sp.]
MLKTIQSSNFSLFFYSIIHDIISYPTLHHP